MAVVWIPSLLQQFAGGQETVDVPGSNLRQVLDNLTARYPALEGQLLREGGPLQEGIAIAVDGQVVTMGLLEPVGERSEVHIIPAIGGGRTSP